MAVQRHGLPPEGKEAVGLARPDQRAGKGAYFQVGDDDPPALGHAVGLRGEHRQPLGNGDIGEQAGDEENPLAADSRYDQLLLGHN